MLQGVVFVTSAGFPRVLATDGSKVINQEKQIPVRKEMLCHEVASQKVAGLNPSGSFLAKSL